VLSLPTLSQQELETGYDQFLQLKRELRMKRQHPGKYRIYQVLRTVLRDSARAWSVMRLLSQLRSLLIGRFRPASE
jgi:hypothetical protein